MPLRKQPQTIGRTLSAAEVTLSIGEVAAAVGVPAGMLRRWGREGLLAPPRSRGGHRTFRAADVARAHRIAELREEGLNAAAIERELGSIERGDSHAGPTGGRRLGRKLRALRERKGWTLKTVADDAAVSLSFLSALERGQTGYSMENLFRLAEALGTTLPELSGAPGHRAGVPLVRPREREQYVLHERRPRGREPHVAPRFARGGADHHRARSVERRELQPRWAGVPVSPVGSAEVLGRERMLRADTRCITALLECPRASLVQPGAAAGAGDLGECTLGGDGERRSASAGEEDVR